MRYNNQCKDREHKKGIIEICNQTGEIPYTDSEITIYCERKNFKNSTGGEDSYPIANSRFILSADGLGSGSCCHSTLGLDAKTLIRRVFGITEDDVEEYDYAMNKCFASPAPNTFFYNEDGNDSISRQPYQNVKLNERTTAYIGSRLVSIAVYHKFGNFALENNISNWWDVVPEDNGVYGEKYHGMPWGKVLTIELQEYITEDLKDILFTPKTELDAPIFSTKGEGINSKCSDYYILPTTLGCVFFANDVDNADEVKALVVWIGDARCYKVDPIDGVKCITRDDSIPHSKDMSALITYADKPINAGHYKDNILNARIVNVKKPCAFISCSDGVYDTCPSLASFARNSTDPQNSTEFEYKLLSILRNSHSMNDAYYGLAYSFYFGAGDWKETTDQYGMSDEQQGIKSDDSGSIALKVFWTKECKFFSDMLSEDTTLDKLHLLIEKGKADFEEYFGEKVIEGELNEEKFLEFTSLMSSKAELGASVQALRSLFVSAFKEVLNEEKEYVAIYGVDPLKSPRSIPIARTYAVRKRAGADKASEQVVNSHFASILKRVICDYRRLEKMLESGDNREEVINHFLEDAVTRNTIVPNTLICTRERLESLESIISVIFGDEEVKSAYNGLFYTEEEAHLDEGNPQRAIAECFERAEGVYFPYYNGKPTNDYFENRESNEHHGESLRDSKYLENMISDIA